MRYYLGGVSAVSVWEGAAAGSAASEWRVSSTEAPSRLHGAAGKPPDGADAGCSGGGVIGVPLDKVGPGGAPLAFDDVVAATPPSGAGLLLPAARLGGGGGRAKAFKVAASV